MGTDRSETVIALCGSVLRTHSGARRTLKPMHLTGWPGHIPRPAVNADPLAHPPLTEAIARRAQVLPATSREGNIPAASGQMG